MNKTKNRCFKKNSNENQRLHVVSRQGEPFENRRQAGRLLGEELKKQHVTHGVVLGIPRGGVIIAHEIAQVLGVEFDLVFTHKLGAPGNQELAIGAVGEEGEVFLNEGLARQLSVPPGYIATQKERQLADIQQRCGMIRDIHPKILLKGKTVIITDDGIATGSTMQAALWCVQQEAPKKIIVALPVGPEEVLEKLAEQADQLICLRVPLLFGSVSQYYKQFNQVQDSEVLELLKKGA